MNYLARRALAGLILGFTASSVLAQDVAVGSATVPLGTNSVDITIDFNNPAGVTGFGFRLTYDTANLDFVGCTAPSLTFCEDFPALSDSGVLIIGNIAAPPANPIATLNFDASAAPVGVYTIDVAAAPPPTYTPGDVALPVTSGSITVQAGPGPGVLNVQPPTLTPPTAAVNGPATTGMITISNDGAPGDASFTPNCTLGAVTGDAGVNITVPAFNSALAPGASANRTASCSGTAAGTAMATYTCTAAGPTVTNDATMITCNTMAGAPVPNPAAGSMVNLLVGPVVRGQSGNATQSFSEVAGSGGTYDVTCNITDNGGGAFALVGSGMVSVPTGGSAGVTVSGQSSLLDPQPTGTMLCTYSNGTTGTVTVTLGIALIPEIVPTLSQWGLILLVLALVGFGAVTVRRRMNVA